MVGVVYSTLPVVTLFCSLLPIADALFVVVVADALEVVVVVIVVLLGVTGAAIF